MTKSASRTSKRKPSAAPKGSGALTMELSLGRRMPAEWEKHKATWIAWPHHEPDWPGKLAPIPWVYAEIVRALSEAGEGPRSSVMMRRWPTMRGRC